MFRRIAILVLGTAGAGVVFFLPMGLMVKDAPAGVIVLAALICLVPGMIVLLAFQRLQGKPPELKIVGVLLATVFRMAAALGGGVGLYLALEPVREHVYAFVGWAVLFYVVTLFIETQLLYIDSSGFVKSSPSDR